MKNPLRRTAMPADLRAALDPGEQIQHHVKLDAGGSLAVSRFGLWVLGGDAPRRIDWHLVSRARLAGGVLELVIADETTVWPDGIRVLVDRAPRTFRPAEATKLTDAVHQRVRGSVAASHHLDWPGAGGWVVLRRIAGRDGLTPQVRLDSGADPSATGFAAAVASVVDRLWPPAVARPAALQGGDPPLD